MAASLCTNNPRIFGFWGFLWATFKATQYQVLIALNVWGRVNDGLSNRNIANALKAQRQSHIGIQIFAHNEGKEETRAGRGFG